AKTVSSHQPTDAVGTSPPASKARTTRRVRTFRAKATGPKTGAQRPIPTRAPTAPQTCSADWCARGIARSSSQARTASPANTGTSAPAAASPHRALERRMRSSARTRVLAPASTSANQPRHRWLSAASRFMAARLPRRSRTQDTEQRIPRPAPRDPSARTTAPHRRGTERAPQPPMVHDPPQPSPPNKILPRDSMLLIGLVGALLVVLAIWALALIL